MIRGALKHQERPKQCPNDPDGSQDVEDVLPPNVVGDESARSERDDGSKFATCSYLVLYIEKYFSDLNSHHTRHDDCKGPRPLWLWEPLGRQGEEGGSRGALKGALHHSQSDQQANICSGRWTLGWVILYTMQEHATSGPTYSLHASWSAPAARGRRRPRRRPGRPTFPRASGRGLPPASGWRSSRRRSRPGRGPAAARPSEIGSLHWLPETTCLDARPGCLNFHPGLRAWLELLFPGCNNVASKARQTWKATCER